MKVGELVTALQKRIEQFGDLEISVSTLLNGNHLQ